MSEPINNNYFKVLNSIRDLIHFFFFVIIVRIQLTHQVMGTDSWVRSVSKYFVVIYVNYNRVEIHNTAYTNYDVIEIK
jgi:hypothetical protein